MLYLREYRPHPNRLSDHLPWVALIGPGLVLNKDGSFQKSLKFRGPDLASSTDSHLLAVRSQINNALRRLGSRWCLHVEGVRHASQEYPVGTFPDLVSSLVDEERRRSFKAEDSHFETRYFLTLTYLPPEETIGRAEAIIVENLPKGQANDTHYRAALSSFQETVAQLHDIFSAIMPEVKELTDEETLTYLHSCVSTKSHPVQMPETPILLDSILTDDDFRGGLYPRLEDHYLQTVSVRAYPTASSPGLLDQLNSLGIAYRWVCRFLPLDKEDARKELNTIRKRWFAKRKGVINLLREAVTREPAALEDSDALSKSDDADAALMILGGDAASMGYFTPTITLLDKNSDRLAAKVREVEATINKAGFVAKVERLNAVEAWLGSLPGHAYADCRRPLISTLNLCDLLPMSAVWSGPAFNKHLTVEARKRGSQETQPALIHARTLGTTPFRLDLHRGDVGHTLIVGPTGSGKSVLLNLLSMQWLRYPEAQVVFFDKGASSRAATLLVAGEFYPLGGDKHALQPLASIDEPSDLVWAHEWLLNLVCDGGVLLTPTIKEEIWSGLKSLAASPRRQRTLTVLAASIQNQEVKAALAPFTLGGPHGALLDAAEENSSPAAWQTFEMGELLANKSAVAPVLTCIFHRFEKRLDGRPTLLVLDEAWLFLDHTAFASKIREWLKTLRKLNVAVLFATQSLADIATSTIAPALIESCPTRIFLPNADASTPQLSSLYRQFGLNTQQIAIICNATPKREYYFQSSAGNRLFELGLGPITLAAVGASSQNDQQQIDRALADGGDAGFVQAYFEARGLSKSVSILNHFRALDVEKVQ